MRDNLFNHLPPMLTGEELIKAMTVLPGYNASMINMPPAVRLIALNDLYKLYIPSAMSLEIYFHHTQNQPFVNAGRFGR